MPRTFTAAPKERPGPSLQLLSSWWGRVGGGAGVAPNPRPPERGCRTGETGVRPPTLCLLPPWALLATGLEVGVEGGSGRGGGVLCSSFLKVA